MRVFGRWARWGGATLATALLCVSYALSACGPIRIDLGSNLVAGDAGIGLDGGADGGLVCAQVAGTYAVTQVAGGCNGGIAVQDSIEVRQPGCDLLFPGPAIEGSATFSPDGNWRSTTLRIGTHTGTCILDFEPSGRSLQIGCGSVCFVNLGAGGTADGG